DTGGPPNDAVVGEKEVAAGAATARAPPANEKVGGEEEGEGDIVRGGERANREGGVAHDEAPFFHGLTRAASSIAMASSWTSGREPGGAAPTKRRAGAVMGRRGEKEE